MIVPNGTSQIDAGASLAMNDFNNIIITSQDYVKKIKYRFEQKKQESVSKDAQIDVYDEMVTTLFDVIDEILNGISKTNNKLADHLQQTSQNIKQNIMNNIIDPPSSKLEQNLLPEYEKAQELVKVIQQNHRSEQEILKSVHDHHREYVPEIQKFININSNDQSKVILNVKVERHNNQPNLETNQMDQRDVIEKKIIEGNTRVPALNGQTGVYSKVDLKAHTVLGEYYGKVLICDPYVSSILEGTSYGQEIDKYSWNINAIGQVPQDHVDYYMGRVDTKPDEVDGDIDMDEKMEQVSIPLILNGTTNVGRDNILRYVNDCRENILDKASIEDGDIQNVDFVQILDRGSPRLFLVTTKDVPRGCELFAYYGDSYGQVIIQGKYLKQRHSAIKKELKRYLG